MRIMKCPKCDFEQINQTEECPKCGIIFDKYLKLIKNRSRVVSLKSQTAVNKIDKKAFIKDLFFYVKPEANPLILGARTLFFIIILIWGFKFISSPMDSGYVMDSFWHLVNLPFHEAGHLIFRPFGRFMTSLGGSLSQLLIPLLCMAVFLLKTRDTFGATFALWWFGENFMDLAPYINDARSLTLPLLGGNTGRTSPYGFHDWEFILKESGLAHYDHALAHFAYRLGTVLMIFALVWGGYILYKQYKNLKG
jgi:hypothetical protein